jgi:hypothetical protein
VTLPSRPQLAGLLIVLAVLIVLAFARACGTAQAF